MASQIVKVAATQLGPTDLQRLQDQPGDDVIVVDTGGVDDQRGNTFD